MGKYSDIEVRENSDNPDDGLKVDWWDEEEQMGYSFAGIIQIPVTPDVTDIEDIHGNYIGRIDYAPDDEEYNERLVELIDQFTS